MPSQSLVGLTTDSGWKVTELLKNNLGSGGNFCVRYIAESKSGEVGFLKAMDLSGVLGDLQRLQETVNQYLFEQDILNECRDKKLSRVVTPLDAGQIIVPNFPKPLNTVYYVIFEKANNNLREYHLETSQKKWLPAFSALHHVAIGIEQLHRVGIAHQDVKPSNVLAFDNAQFKISDMGRVVDESGKSPFRSIPFPGDPSYKPIEMFFGIYSLEFIDRRSCDMYMVGSLVYHLVEDTPINAGVITEARLLDSNIQHKPYADALPFLLTGFNTILRRYKKHCIELFGDKIAELLVNVVYEMCYPDSGKRGAPKFIDKHNRYSMRRYASKLGNIVRHAKIHRVS